MTQVMELLAFVREAKSTGQITEEFGRKTWTGNMNNLVRKGCVEKFEVFNEDSGGKYQRSVVTAYRATGVEYKGNAGFSRRSEYQQQYYQARKAKKNATQTPQP